MINDPVIKMTKGINLKTVEVSVEAVATVNISDEPHGELMVDLWPDIHQVGNLQGSPSMPWGKQETSIVKIFFFWPDRLKPGQHFTLHSFSTVLKPQLFT